MKIERLGQFDLKGLNATPNSRKKLNAFYLGLVDCLQRRLDATSVESGSLQQTYEIFDLAGAHPTPRGAKHREIRPRRSQRRCSPGARSAFA